MHGFLLDRHIASLIQAYQYKLDGKTAKAEAIRAFYTDYFAAMDLPAEFYLETVSWVFQQHALNFVRVTGARRLVVTRVAVASACARSARRSASASSASRRSCAPCPCMSACSVATHCRLSVSRSASNRARASAPATAASCALACAPFWRSMRSWSISRSARRSVALAHSCATATCSRVRSSSVKNWVRNSCNCRSSASTRRWPSS
ncbi:hypothetical protein [Cupriavidus sp. 8B]